MVKEFLSEKDLDDAGLFTKPHRDRLIKAGKLPAPIQFGPNGKRLYPREFIDKIKALAGKAEAVIA